MKAEERHRLAENDLSKSLKQLSGGIRRPSNMILIMVGLALALGLVYWYWSSVVSSRVSTAWLQYYGNRDQLEDAPPQWKSGPAGHAIQLGAADQAYDRGYRELFLDPPSALRTFQAAAAQYEELSRTASNLDIQLRALIGAARSYENIGEASKAVALYDAALNKFGALSDWKDHPLVKDAKDHRDKLAASGENTLGVLYQSWASKLKQIASQERPSKQPEIPSIPLPPIP